jgi:O-antigen ligase
MLSPGPPALKPGASAVAAPTAVQAALLRPTVPVPPPSSPVELLAPDDPVRKLAFLFGLAFVFVRLAVLPEMLQHIFGFRTYLLYIVGPPALIGGILAIRPTLRHRAAILFVGFFLWMGLATVFSSWIGGSVNRTLDFVRFCLPLLFVVGGLAVNWKEVRWIFSTCAAALVVNLVSSHFFVEDSNGRYTFEASGTIGNSNDLAAHILLLIPFMLALILERGRNTVVRIALVCAIVVGLHITLGTASRGGLLAIAAGALFYLLRAPLKQRLMFLFTGVVLAFVLIATVPDAAARRLHSMFSEENTSDEAFEAGQSAQSREYLFRKSIEYSFRRPLFGVGPDQFVNFEGKESKALGRRGNWHATHCTWTQVSSENGLSALVLFAGAVVLVFRSVNRLLKMARDADRQDISNFCFCYLLSVVMFCTAATFLSHAYGIYFPFIIGLGICLSHIGGRELLRPAAPAGSILVTPAGRLR